MLKANTTAKNSRLSNGQVICQLQYPELGETEHFSSNKAYKIELIGVI